MIVVFLAAALSISGLDLSAQNLKGEPRAFPADLAQHRAIVVMTFSKSASDEASKWTQKLRENQQNLAATIYQIACLENVPALFRSFVLSALRRAIPRELHDNFWIATSFSKEWRERTRSVSIDQAHVLVFENRTQVIWGFHGAFSELGLQSLRAALSAQHN